MSTLVITKVPPPQIVVRPRTPTVIEVSAKRGPQGPVGPQGLDGFVVAEQQVDLPPGMEVGSVWVKPV